MHPTPPTFRVAQPRFLGDGVPEPGIGGCKEPPPSQFAPRTEVISLAGFPRRAGPPARATALSDWLFFLALACYPLCPLPPAADTLLSCFSPAPARRLPLHRRPASSRLPPAPTGGPSASAP